MIVIGVAAWGTLRGFRQRFSAQVPSLIGMAFGIVCARMFCEPAEQIITDLWMRNPDPVTYDYAVSNIACGLIYIVAYFLFKFVTMIVGKVLAARQTEILDNISGAILGLVRYMILLSVCYNLILSFSPDSRLLKSASADDGNVVREAMLISPALLGSESVLVLSHRRQLEEAKKIS